MSDDLPDCTNPDMQGYSVRIANFSTNVCLAILIAYSECEIETAVHSLLLQLYSVLIATVISVATLPKTGDREVNHPIQLNRSDAIFAFSITSPPLAFYLLFSALNFVQKPNRFYQRVGETRTIIPFLSISFFILWFLLQVVIPGIEPLVPTGKTRVFSNEVPSKAGSNKAPSNDICAPIAITHWMLLTPINWVGLASGDGVHFWLPNMALFALITWSWIICLVRHRKSFKSKYDAQIHQHSSWLTKLAACISIPWLSVLECHPWLQFLMILFAYTSWAHGLRLDYVEPGYELSFGQIMSLTIAVPPFLSTVKLIINRRKDIPPFIEHCSSLFLPELIFLMGMGPSRDLPLPILSLTATPRPVLSTSSPSTIVQSPISSSIVTRLAEPLSQRHTLSSVVRPTPLTDSHA